jgi:hypothetical protein
MGSVIHNYSRLFCAVDFRQIVEKRGHLVFSKLATVSTSNEPEASMHG